MTKEIWKDIVGYEGIYQISNTGKIKRGARIGSKGKIWKDETISLGNFDRYGYLRTQLNKKCKREYFMMHQLVAIYFIPNPEKKNTVNHLDGIKTNNNINNLQWCTYGENSSHAHKIGLIDIKGVNCHLSKLSEKEVIDIFKSNKATRELAAEYSVDRSNIRYIKMKKTWKHLTKDL